ADAGGVGRIAGQFRDVRRWVVEMNILLAVTGSVAAIRAPRLASSLASLGTVRAALTSAAVHFLERSEEAWPKEVEQLFDADEWKAWNQLGDPVVHIEL